MEHANIDPNEIGVWWPQAKASDALVELVRRDGNFRLFPRVPVFVLPPEVQAEHKYLLADGHKRRDAALRLGLWLPCAVYAHTEIIDPRRDGLDEFDFLGGADGWGHYNAVLTLYQDPSIVKKYIAEQARKQSAEGR